MHPIIAKIGPFTIYSYGMMVAIAFLFGIFIAKLEAARKNIKPDLVYDFSFYLIIGSIIGARARPRRRTGLLQRKLLPLSRK